jgi:hypothetical protein
MKNNFCYYSAPRRSTPQPPKGGAACARTFQNTVIAAPDQVRGDNALHDYVIAGLTP